jgi:Cu-Zn family superoxide dismutase
MVVAAACLLAIALFATAGALAQVPPVGATADVKDATGRTLATAEFREGRGEVLVTIIFPNPATLTGTHGLRIHEVGRCDAPAFATAGSGFNPLNKKHGRQNPDGPQVGDLPNVNFTTGLTSYNTAAMGATLGAGATSLMGPNRTALIIYSGEDDQLTDPDGKAGTRIGCGVISPAAGLAAQLALSPVVPVQPLPAQPAVPVQPVQPVQPGVPVQPTPTRPTNTPIVVGVPKPVTVASPVVAQPVVPKPVVSVVVPTLPPIAPPVAAVQQPIVAPQQPLPTAPPVAAPSTQTSGGIGTFPALIIAVLGVGLVGGGWLLRRRSQLTRERGG